MTRRKFFSVASMAAAAQRFAIGLSHGGKIKTAGWEVRPWFYMALAYVLAYSFLKTAGPAHLSFGDRGITFATNGDRGVCVAFREPVPGIEPTGRLRHPGATLTLADVDGFAAALTLQGALKDGRRG